MARKLGMMPRIRLVCGARSPPLAFCGAGASGAACAASSAALGSSVELEKADAPGVVEAESSGGWLALVWGVLVEEAKPAASGACCAVIEPHRINTRMIGLAHMAK